MPDKLSSYVDIDMDITLRGIAAITSITESIFVIVRKTAGAESDVSSRNNQIKKLK